MTNEELAAFRREISAWRRELIGATVEYATDAPEVWKTQMHESFLLSQVDRLLSELQDSRVNHRRTAELFDALGIWTGVDDILWDRLDALLTGMGGYCDPTKTKEVVDRMREKWRAQ